MTEELKDVKITELENVGFTEQQEKHLTDLFVATVKHMMPTLSRESWFKLDDFFNAETHGVAVVEA